MIPENYAVKLRFLVYVFVFVFVFVYVFVYVFMFLFMFMFIVWTHFHLEIMGPPTICIVWKEAALFIGRVL